MHVRTFRPDTGFERPTDPELARLHRIAAEAHPWIFEKAARVSGAEFARAFIAAGYLFRTAAPRMDRYFSDFVNIASEMLDWSFSQEAVTGAAFLAAIIAHGDVVWRRADASAGQLLEVGLDQYSGLRCTNKWRGILDGSGNLLSPAPPSQARRHLAEPSRLRIYHQGRDGNFRLLRDDAALWETN